MNVGHTVKNKLIRCEIYEEQMKPNPGSEQLRQRIVWKLSTYPVWYYEKLYDIQQHVMQVSIIRSLNAFSLIAKPASAFTGNNWH